MNALALSLIRTYVPIIVGAAVSWLVTLGIELDAQTQAGVIVALTGLLQAIYYTAVRLAETRWPGIGALLGAAKSPDTYSKGEEVPAVTAEVQTVDDVSTEVSLPPLDAPGPDHAA